MNREPRFQDGDIVQVIHPDYPNEQMTLIIGVCRNEQVGVWEYALDRPGDDADYGLNVYWEDELLLVERAK